MGESYDGMYFYGLLFDESETGWPETTRGVFEQGDAEDFDQWLDRHLGIAPWRVGGKRVREYEDVVAEREAKCLAAFGVPGFEFGFLGHINYSVYYLAPKGARWSEWRVGAVPTVSEEQVEVWRDSCVRLAAVLPGSSGPGFYFGCSVG